MSDDLLYTIALTKVPKVGYKLSKTLISYSGSAEKVFQTKGQVLKKIPGIGEQVARNILNFSNFDAAEKDLAFCQKHEIEILRYTDDQYPQRLLHHEDSPTLLFYRGVANLNKDRMLAIVGTRSPTVRGKHMTQKIVEELKAYNVTVVSGLAYGIDAAAHRAALEHQIPTIGVLGNGIDRIYPSAHTKLSKEMMNTGGILSQFAIGSKPDRENFPMRNKVVAGMCDAVIVVESAVSGGSIITAEFANHYNKDVFAIPGRISDEKSAGCNRLIRIHKANLLESAADIAYIMRWESGSTQVVQRSLDFTELSENQSNILKYLKEKESANTDDMHLDLQLSLSELANLLLELELKGIIISHPGKRYSLA